MQPIMRAFRIFKVRENGNLEFWVSQAVILVSTVLGVYLAAMAGYKAAVEFEVARTDREGYYVRRALLNELKQNLDWGDRMAQAAQADAQEGGFRFRMGRQAPQTFVWDTMKQQSATLQLPPETLGDIREYYASAGDHVKAIMQPGNTSAVREGEASAWLDETRKMRAGAVKSLESDMAAIHDELTARGVRMR